MIGEDLDDLPQHRPFRLLRVRLGAASVAPEAALEAPPSRTE